MGTFSSILDRQTGTSPKPLPLPIGTYTVLAKSHKIDKQVGQNKNDRLTYDCAVLAPDQDVDPGQLAAMPNGLAGKTVKVQFWLTEDAAYRLEDFLQNIIGLTGMSNGQAVPLVCGKQFKVHIKHRPGENDMIWSDVDSFAKAA